MGVYNGGVIVVVCGVALCEEVRCISGGLHQRWCISSSQGESGVGKRWRPWGLSLVLSGGSLGLLPFPAVSIAAGGLWRSLLQRRASFCSPEVRLNRVSGAWMYEDMNRCMTKFD